MTYRAMVVLSRKSALMIMTNPSETVSISQWCTSFSLIPHYVKWSRESAYDIYETAV